MLASRHHLVTAKKEAIYQYYSQQTWLSTPAVSRVCCLSNQAWRTVLFFDFITEKNHNCKTNNYLSSSSFQFSTSDPQLEKRTDLSTNSAIILLWFKKNHGFLWKSGLIGFLKGLESSAMDFCKPQICVNKHHKSQRQHHQQTRQFSAKWHLIDANIRESSKEELVLSTASCCQILSTKILFSHWYLFGDPFN